MSSLNDDAERIRIDDDRYRHLDRSETSDETEGAQSFLGVTVALSSYPTTAGVFFAVQPLGLLGTETEGATGTTTNIGDPIFCKHIGTSVPPVGTSVICTLPGYRWVFEY